MRRYIVAILVTITGCGLLFQTAASALSIPSQLIITEVRLGGETIARDGINYKQYVTLYNQGDTPVQLDDGWKLEYAKVNFEGTCDAETWNDESPVLSGIVAPHGSATIDYQLTDEVAGAIRISDAQHVVHDMVGWGSDSPCAETTPVAAVPTAGKSVTRFAGCDGTLTDTDTNDNSRDFTADAESFASVTLPDCTPTCNNTQLLENSVCVDDVCSNVPDIQTAVPEGYYVDGGKCSETPIEPEPATGSEPPNVDLLPLAITEVLPNAEGIDKGNEFVELYNPNDTAVDLAAYSLAVGDTSDKVYPLPADKELAGHEYLQIKDTDAGFVLPNTGAKLALKTADGQVIDETSPYEKPKDDQAWALIDGVWQYTNQPTPSAANILSVPDKNEDVPAPGRGSAGEPELKPCAANQERNPETNRCRLIASVNASSTTSDLTPCKEGQYRSEETNRCRSAASTSAASTLTPCSAGQERNPETNRCRSTATSTSSSTLTPCKPGQERNPDTNRCRSTEVAAAGELTPCKENQERNPDTNRCRAVAAANVPEATFAAEPVPDTGKAFTGWWVLGGVGALAAGRIGWEWRNEIGAGIRKVGTFFTSGK